MSRRIFLYLAIPAAKSFRKVERRGLKRLRNIARRRFDIMRWAITGKLQTHYTTFEDHKNSNAGDIAVGVAIRQILQSAWTLIPDDIVEVGWGDLDEECISRINEEAAVFVIGGSGYLHCGAHGQLSPLVQADVPKLERLTCPIVTVGVGLNRIIESEWLDPEQCIEDQSLELLRRFSRVVACHSVRDDLTKIILEKSGARGVQVIGDPALHLGKAERVSGEHRPGDRLRIGVNFSLHGPNSQDMLFANIGTYIAFLKWLESSYKCELIYFAHSDAERFIWKILRQKGVNIDFVDGPPAELLESYGTIDLHVCQMMHSAILAMACGVPTLNLGYDMKNLYLFKLMSLGDRCRNVVNISLDDMTESFQSLYKSRNEINEVIIDRQPELASRVAFFLASVSDHLGWNHS